jgi:hypothetical protein
MRGTIVARATDPLKQEFTISITLPLDDWLTFAEQAEKMQGAQSYPAWHIIDGIKDVARNARLSFTKEIISE